MGKLVPLQPTSEVFKNIYMSMGKLVPLQGFQNSSYAGGRSFFIIHYD